MPNSKEELIALIEEKVPGVTESQIGRQIIADIRGDEIDVVPWKPDSVKSIISFTRQAVKAEKFKRRNEV